MVPWSLAALGNATFNCRKPFPFVHSESWIIRYLCNVNQHKH